MVVLIFLLPYLELFSCFNIFIFVFPYGPSWLICTLFLFIFMFYYYYAFLLLKVVFL